MKRRRYLFKLCQTGTFNFMDQNFHCFRPIIKKKKKDFLNLTLSLIQWAYPPSNQHCGFVWVSNICPDWLLAYRCHQSSLLHVANIREAAAATVSAYTHTHTHTRTHTYIQKEDVASKTGQAMPPSWDRVVFSRRAGEKEIYKNICLACFFFHM